MAMSMLLRRMKTDVTVHGFRSSLRDWAAECTGYPHEVCEMALAHTIGNKAVVLVYDPLQTTRGKLCLKAFRLTQAFMDNFRKLSAKGRETT